MQERSRELETDLRVTLGSERLNEREWDKDQTGRVIHPLGQVGRP